MLLNIHPKKKKKKRAPLNTLGGPFDRRNIWMRLNGSRASISTFELIVATTSAAFRLQNSTKFSTLKYIKTLLPFFKETLNSSFPYAITRFHDHKLK
jgi:hypothetical protein